MINPISRAILAGAAAASATAASAHDFFLLPEQFIVASPGEATIRATVGAEFPEPETAVPVDRIRRVGAAGSGASLEIGDASANATALTLSAPRTGVAVAGASTHPRDVDYGEDRIDLIMQEYRVDPEVAAQVRNLPSPRTLRVSSRRFAKTIVCVVRCDDWAVAQRPLGMPLEFVAAGSDRDHFQLLREGRPLANYPVDLATSSGERLRLSTDADGEVHLPSNARGALMLFAAAMLAPADGERFVLKLSSLTFSR